MISFIELLIETDTFDKRRVKFVTDHEDIMHQPDGSKPLTADQYYALRRARQGASNEIIAREMEISLKAVQHHLDYAWNKGWFVPPQKPGANPYPDLDDRLHKILDSERDREPLDNDAIHSRIKAVYPEIKASTIERRVRALRRERIQK